MKENAVLLEETRQGIKESRDALVEKNLGLVHHIVHRFLGRGYDAEDLFQIGVIGLIKAIDKFDASYGVQLSTYAVPLIAGEIKRFLRDDGMVKVSRGLKENGWKIRIAAEEISVRMGREATVNEIADQTGLTVEDIAAATEANCEVESIYKSIYHGDGNEIFLADQVVEGREHVGRLRDDYEACEDREKDHLINRIMIEQLMEDLSEKEKVLIISRYFENITQVEVADKLGISQVQVSRLEKKILIQLRRKMTDTGNRKDL